MGDSFFAPLRMIAGIALGSEALGSETSLGTAIVVGLLVHMGLSALFGAAFGAIAGAVEAMHRTRGALVLTASVFGLALWLVNFYLIAPALFPWFANSSPWVQFIGHTFFFGSVLGLLVGSRLESPAEARTPTSAR